jgi:hypothetical protein
MTGKQAFRKAFGLVMLGVATGCSVSTVARVPEANIIEPKNKAGGTFTVDASSVPENEVCTGETEHTGFCVSRFRAAIGGGLKKVLAMYLDGDKTGPAYTARFRFVQFSDNTTSSRSEGGGTEKITLRWQFELLDPSGEPVVQLAETTDGPQQFSSGESADDVIDALLAAVMEKVAASLKAANLSTRAALPSSAAAPATLPNPSSSPF